MGGKKVKISATIDEDILEHSKRICDEKNIPLSRVIENFLRFFSNPWVYCFSCGKKFTISMAKTCHVCGWLVCPECGACRCSIPDNAAQALYFMRKVYEDLLMSRVG